MQNNRTIEGYSELLAAFQPRLIETKEECEQVQAEHAYLTLLGMLMMDYEAETETKENYELRGIELIKGLVSYPSLKALDLPVVSTRQPVLKRLLTEAHRHLELAE